MDPHKLSHIIEMLEKIAKIKRLISRDGDHALAQRDLKFFIRTNKGMKGQVKHHIT